MKPYIAFKNLDETLHADSPLRSLRLGFATNSSSSHSVIIHRDERRAKSEGEPWGDHYGFENFALHTAKEKFTYYLADCPMNDIAYLDEVAKRLGFPNVLEAKTMADVDHESQGTTATPKGVDPKMWLELLLSDEVSIYGGSDNSYDYPCRDEIAGIEVNADIWKMDGPALIGYTRRNGTKFRISPVPYEKSSTPELVDLKITDYCGYGCAFCYQGSTKEGLHASLDTILPILDQLSEMEVFEVAIGGGEPSHHPDFTKILSACSDRGIIPNFTSYGTDWVNKLPSGYRGGVGMSVHSAAEITKPRRAREAAVARSTNGRVYPQIVAQTVVGCTDTETLLRLVDECFKEHFPLLLLGYKRTGRGGDFQPFEISDQDMTQVLTYTKAKLDALEDWVLEGAASLSVDTAFLDRYGEVLDRVKVPTHLRSSPEGKFSMYIDAVTGRVGPSSYAPEMMEPMGDIKAQFAKW